MKKISKAISTISVLIMCACLPSLSACQNNEDQDGNGVIHVESVNLNKNSLNLYTGESEELVANVLPEDATEKRVEWTTSNNDVATVLDGVVTAVGSGTATIVAKSIDGNKTAECSVLVPEYDLTMWTAFGTSFDSDLQNSIEHVEKQNDIKIRSISYKNYPLMQTLINNSVASESYPNIATGFNDHFAGYIKANIQKPLDTYIDKFDTKNNSHLLDDYYPEYLYENMTLKYDESDSPYIMGLPFSNSTEVLVYNGYFVDYAASIDASLGTLPDTWAEWETKGESYMNVMKTLFGKRLCGVINNDGTVSDFAVIDATDIVPTGKEELLDLTKVSSTRFKLMSWDALDNMFITLCRQWGGVYTSYTPEDRKNNRGNGWARFFDDKFTMDDSTVIKPREITTEMLNYIKGLHDKDLIGSTSEIGEGAYASGAFKYGRTMFVVCSSGGLDSKNFGDFDARVHPILYRDISNKKVISRNVNFALFDKESEITMQRGFDTIVTLTRGDIQGEWAAQTGYFPTTKSATDSNVYQDFLNTPQTTTIKQVYQKSAKLNNEVYSSEAEGWDKIVDPGFVGSTQIRAAVESIMTMLFGNTKTINEIMKITLSQIKLFLTDETLSYISSL